MLELLGHADLITGFRAVIVTVDADATARYRRMDSMKDIADTCGIAVEMIFGGILERCRRLGTLYTVGAGYAVADELYAALRQLCGPKDIAVLVENEAPELRMRLQSFHGIGHTHGMFLVGEGRGECHHRVGRTVETDLESLAAVYLHHEISAHRTCHHLQRCTFEVGPYLSAGEVECRTLRIGEVYTSHIFYTRVVGFYHITLYRQRGTCENAGGKKKGCYGSKDSFVHNICYSDCYK